MHRRLTAATELMLQPAPFDYEQLHVSHRTAIQDETKVIRNLVVATARNVVQIGLHLKFVRKYLGRDYFQAWLRAEFRWSQSVASNYMRTADVFCDIDSLDFLQPSALYVLARRKVTDAARAEALERARHGEMITKTIAVEIVNKYDGSAAIRRRDVVANVLDELQAIGREIETISDPERDRLIPQVLELLDKLQKRPPA
jgi:hypothetical protein